VEVESSDGRIVWGAGIHANIVQASLEALISVSNQLSDT
jgi:2-isopropylmalate synthase